MTGVRHDPFFYTDPSSIGTEKVVVEGDDARHLLTARRARPGDLVCISDGEGRVLDVRITDINTQRLTGEILKEQSIAPAQPSISVFQGLAKGPKLDLVIQKLVEIGVDEVVIFSATRSVPRWDDKRAAKAASRWRAIGREAAKQSRRARLPRIEGPVDLTSAARMMDGLILIADEKADAGLRALLPAEPPERVAIVVGPEGGLDEADLIAIQGARRVLLGPQILRTETAALVAATAVMYHYGLIG